jgi:hypothetical protein
MRALKRTDGGVRSLDATIARVNYLTGELWVVGDDGFRALTLSDGCRLWFNGRSAPLRCFHPLDRIRVRYTDSGSGFVAEALDLWAEEFEPSRCRRNWEPDEMDMY